MLKNYIDETYLKGKTPELDEYLWASESDYTLEKASAEDIVKADFNDKGFQMRLLRPRLTLDTTTEEEDIGNRNRVVIITSAVTGTASVAVKGCNTDDGTYVTAGTSSSITTTGTSTFLLDDYYKYYKYALTGTATVAVYLVESANYDLLYAYMWLYLILKNKMSRKEDQFDIKAEEFLRLYNERWQNFSPFYDADEDGEITQSEKESLMVRSITH